MIRFSRRVFHMVTLGSAVFWIANIILVGMFLFGLAFGWEHGGKRMGLDALKTIIHFAATVLLTIFLTKRYSWFEYQSFYDYLDSKRMPGTPLHSPVEVDKFRFYRSGIIWFFIALVGIELIMGIAIRIYKKKHPREKTPLSKADHIAGEIAGGLLIILWIVLLAPVAVSTEKTELFTNGSDLINKTVAKIPVNYIAKPVTKLIAPDSALSRVWDEGIGEVSLGLYDADKWIEENKNDVKVVADLTGIFYSMESSLEDLNKH